MRGRRLCAPERAPGPCCLPAESEGVRACAPDTGTEAAIPLPNVSAKILSKVIEYCKFHVAAEKKVDDKPAKTEEEVKNYDAEFVKVDQGTLFELILVRARAALGTRPKVYV